MRRLWITDDPYPASPETVALAEQAGATEIVHGDTFVGYVEEPDPEVPEPDPVEALQAQVQAQQETIDALLAALGGGNE